jgi:ABC-2 type transport system permease protein
VLVRAEYRDHDDHIATVCADRLVWIYPVCGHAAIMAMPLLRGGPMLASHRMSAQATHRYGPSATGGDLRRFVELTLTLARTEFKLRYFGSALGYVWSLIRPLLFFGVIYVVFTQIFHISKGVPHYGVYLLTGIVLWTYFAEATAGSVQCLVQREAMLRKVRFPRMVIPLAVSLTALFNLGMNFVAVIIFALANGVTPRPSWLELIPIALGFMIIATGLAMLLSALYVRYRDVQPIWDVTAQVLFYSSPVMYTASAYHSLEHLAFISPFVMLLTQMGHAFVSLELPSAATAAGGTLRLLIPTGIIFATFALGWWVFTREAPRVAENL